MKKLITALFLTFFTIGLYPQSEEGFIMIADGISYGAREYNYSASGQFDYHWVFDDYKDIYMPIFIGETRIAIESQGDIRLQITRNITPVKHIDNDGDPYILFQFNCRDNDGGTPLVAFQAWDDYDLVRMFVYYEDVAIRYKGYLQDK